MNGERFDDWLGRAVAGLPRERDPADDLWPGIEARLAPGRRRAGPAWAAAAAMVGALAVAVWLGRSPVRAPEPGLERVRWTAAESAAHIDAQYRDALLAVSGRSGGLRLQGTQQALVEAELSQIESAQRSIRRAMKEQPNSKYLVSLLAHTHARRLELVQQLAGRPVNEGVTHENGNV